MCLALPHSHFCKTPVKLLKILAERAEQHFLWKARLLVSWNPLKQTKIVYWHKRYLKTVLHSRPLISGHRNAEWTGHAIIKPNFFRSFWWNSKNTFWHVKKRQLFESQRLLCARCSCSFLFSRSSTNANGPVKKNHETLLEPCLLFAVNKIAIKQLFDDQWARVV